MSQSNFERMMQLAEDVFDARNDPNQLDIHQEVLERMVQLHPATVSEFDDGNGPVAWVLLIPTTSALMHEFLSGHISEKELFNRTSPGQVYDALYLCSALVLPEFRRQGIVKNLTLDAIRRIRKNHPIQYLFVWAFSAEGELSAEALARLTTLPLLKRTTAE